MCALISKYKEFKIYDEKGRVYPLNISRAINSDTIKYEESQKEDED